MQILRLPLLATVAVHPIDEQRPRRGPWPLLSARILIAEGALQAAENIYCSAFLLYKVRASVTFSLTHELTHLALTGSPLRMYRLRISQRALDPHTSTSPLPYTEHPLHLPAGDHGPTSRRCPRDLRQLPAEQHDEQNTARRHRPARLQHSLQRALWIARRLVDWRTHGHAYGPPDRQRQGGDRHELDGLRLGTSGARA